MRLLLCLILLFGPPSQPFLRAQQNDADMQAAAKELLSRGDWEGALRLLPASKEGPPEIDYLRGMALARLGRLTEARSAFEAGQRKAPLDSRFPLELAGIAFKQKRLDDARAQLRRAMRRAPGDPYAGEFLATVYHLQDNLPAALKYWNRVNKPLVESIRAVPALHLNASLLDRALVVPPASVLRLEDYRTMQSRVEALEILANTRFELSPRADQKFDLILRSIERNGWGSGWLEGCLGVLRGAPYQTIYPAYFNIRRSAWNWQALARWDSNKERLYTTLAGPLGLDPSWRLAAYFDGRDEDWQLVPALEAQAEHLHRRILKAGVDISSLPSAKWNWVVGAAVSHRKGSPADTGTDPALFRSGTALEQRLGLNRELVFLPERRLAVRAFALSEAARFFGHPAQHFARLQIGVVSSWFPSAGRSLVVTGRFRAGTILGHAPFDELFSLGLERDNDTGMRGHPGTTDGRKGRGPLGDRYLLLNLDFQKRLLRWSVLELSLGPFVDAGRICSDLPSSQHSSCGKWLTDVGLQARLGVVGGPAVVFSFGSDPRSGRKVLFGSTAR